MFVSRAAAPQNKNEKQNNLAYMFKHIDINVKLAENDIINNMKQHIAIKCEEIKKPFQG